MKVLIVHNNYQSAQIGGEDLVVKREIAGLAAVLGAENVLSYQISNDDIQPAKLAFTLWGNRTHAERVADLVKKNAIDIVHVHNFFPLLTPSVFEAAKAAGAKVIHTLHNFRWWCISGVLQRPAQTPCESCAPKAWGLPGVIHACYRQSRVQSLVASVAFLWYRLRQYQRHIDAYFALTPFQQQKIAQFGLRDNVWLKPNPIDIPPPYQPMHKQHYLFVGRLESAKGIELLLDTWTQLPADYHLDIIGDSDERTRLEQRYQQNNIRFLGQLPHADVMRRTQQAQYVVHPSLAYETFGLSLVEALALGTPVIGLDIGTRPDFIRHGENGFLCKTDTLLPTILASKDFSEYNEMSVQAFASAKPYYLPEVIAQQVALYKQVGQACH